MKRKNCFVLILLPIFIVSCSNVCAQAEVNTNTWKAPQTLQQLAAAPVALIPFPQKTAWRKGELHLIAQASLIINEPDKGLTAIATKSLEKLLAKNGVLVKKTGTPIRLKPDDNSTLKKEGYRLQVNEHGITINANDAGGFFNGVQTLRQLIIKKSRAIAIPFCTITDWPAFGLRGFMHDNGRNFQSIEMLKEQLEILSQYKFNTFHWHLTDDPAWRIESKVYPQLNDPKNRKAGRDPDSSYSFNDIRELIRFAAERNIKIIPELDMPGHSAFFKTTFGFKMETEQGMQVLERLIDEFCREIPAQDCPIIHIGSDEVHIPNPAEFIQRISKKISDNNRKAVVWNPGLPSALATIQQVWREDQATKAKFNSEHPYIDSYGGYLNIGTPVSLLRRYFFQQVCNKPVGDDNALGGILCCWPDVRVDNKSKIYSYNPVSPGLITFSEAVWCGRPHYDALPMNIPAAKEMQTEKYFTEFETRLARHRDLYFNGKPFPFFKSGNIEWQMSDLYKAHTDPPINDFFSAKVAMKQKAVGAEVNINPWLLPQLKDDTALYTAYFTSYIFSKTARQIKSLIGFETPARSNRQCSGIPMNYKWDANGGAVFVNGRELPGPVWQNPGGNRYLKPTWHTEANEIPYTDEEFYWTRKPATIHLIAGWNQVVIKVPRRFKDQKWMFAFVPVKLNSADNWVKDEAVKMVSDR